MEEVKMGIDIYLGGYDAYNERTKQERAAFELAARTRDKLPRDSEESKTAQWIVELCSDRMWAGSKGYLRSSYNSGGLFNVLDKVFGTDTGSLLFPKSWDKDQQVDWDKYLMHVRHMQQAVAALKHGDPLPIVFEELKAKPTKQRQSGEAFGKAVAQQFETLAATTELQVAETPEQHGFFNQDDYGWYVTEGLKDLREFGELGRKEHAEGKDTRVHISY
jgi:hypothetical protein